jgi:hypothetical protein
VTLNIELRTLRAAFFTAVRWQVLDESTFKAAKLCQLDNEPPLSFSAEDFSVLLSVISSAGEDFAVHHLR